MKKKLIAIIVGMMLCAELLGGCGNKNINKDNITTDTAEESKQQDSNKKQELPTATYMGGSNTITEVCDELGSAGASHVDMGDRFCGFSREECKAEGYMVRCI